MKDDFKTDTCERGRGGNRGRGEFRGRGELRGRGDGEFRGRGRGRGENRGKHGNSDSVTKGEDGDLKQSNEETEALKLKFEAMELELTKVKTKLIDSNNEIADNSCVYCLSFISPDSQYNKAAAPFNARLTCSHSNFHMKCAIPDLEER